MAVAKGRVLELGEGQAKVRQNQAAVAAALEASNSRREGAILDAEKHHAAAAAHFTRAGEFEQQAFVASTDQVKQQANTNAYQW